MLEFPSVVLHYLYHLHTMDNRMKILQEYGFTYKSEQKHKINTVNLHFEKNTIVQQIFNQKSCQMSKTTARKSVHRVSSGKIVNKLVKYYTKVLQ